jgi:hypothetical protein
MHRTEFAKGCPCAESRVNSFVIRYPRTFVRGFNFFKERVFLWKPELR